MEQTLFIAAAIYMLIFTYPMFKVGILSLLTDLLLGLAYIAALMIRVFVLPFRLWRRLMKKNMMRR